MNRNIAFATGIACGLLARPALAIVDGPSPGAVSASTLKLPDKPGSIKGLSDDASVQVFSGHISYSVPFDLPPGRAGFGPQLSLSYSGELGNGPLGIGWSLGLISIKRTLRHGVPTYTDSDELELVGIGGGGRLVPDGKLSDRYWVEGQGKTVKVDRQGNLFIVTDGSGTVYVLGGTANSKQGDDQRTSAWFVDLITNVAGEQVLVDYEQDQGQIYFHEIGWGPKQTGSCPGPSFRLTGHTEARPDVAVSWASGIEVHTAKRFDYFEVHSFCETLRTYALTYNTTVDSYKTAPQLSRLANVHMTGRGGQGALPDLKFGYADPEPAAARQMDNVAGWQLNQRGTSIADVDGDGVGDLLRLELGNHQYKKNIGGAYADARPLTGAGSIDLESSRLMDVDGDARAELVYIVDDTWRVYRLQGEKWVPAIDGAWPGTKMVPLSGPDVVFADINGDGSTDVIQSAATGIRIRFGSKTGLGDAVTLPRISADDVTVDPGRSDVQFVDMNGDGLADVVYLTDQWAKIWLGRGDGTFVYFNRVAYPWTSSVLDLSGIRIVDMDRDGIPDLVRISAGNVSYYPGLPDGTFWPVGRMVARPAGDAVDSVVTIADANGNGSQDIVWSTPDGMWVLDMAGPTSAGMLTTIDNGMGKTTTFQYQGSGVLSIMDENAGNPWTYKLPISVPVPIYATIDPGAGGVERVVRYGVRDGFWDGDERRFGGFLIGGKTVPAETKAATYYEETRFHAGIGEDRVLRGKPYLVEQQDGGKNVFTRKKFAVEARAVAGLPANPLTKKPATTVEDDYSFEGVSKPIETFTTYEYDNEVRLTKEHHAGRLDVTGDEKEVVRTYADNEFYWVRDKVCQEETYEADSSTLVSRTFYLYGEGQTLATAEPNQLCGVGRGLLIDTYGYLASPADPSPPLSWHEIPHNVLLSRHYYDAYGNVTFSKEGGVSRTLGYDSSSLHPTSETVSPDGIATLGWNMTWDNALGLPKTMTDPNQVSTTVDYDELGRYIGAKIGSNSQHVRYVYDWAAPMPRTTTYVYDGALDSIPTKDPTQDWVNAVGWRQTTMVANGAGEELFSATRLASQQWIVTDWKERDGRGKVVKHGDAFYWTGSDPRLATPPTVGATDPNYFRYQTLKYDALGRLIEQDLPNGATKTVSFKAFEQTVTASELAPVRSVLDGFGRVTRTERTVSGIVESVKAVYDADDRIRTMSLQDGKAVHEYRYDTLGRMAWAKDPDIGVRELRHSDEGYLIRHKNGAGDVLGFVYDQVGRLSGRGTFVRVPNAPDPFADQAASPYVTPAWTSAYTYAYDKKATTDVSACSAAHTAGRLAAVDEPAISGAGVGRVAFCYDELGRQNAMVRSINGGVAKAWMIDRQGASGMLLSQEADDGFKLYTAYDRAGRLQSLDDNLTAPGDIWHAGATSVPDAMTGLDAAGRVFSETYGNGLVQGYQRDKLGLPSDIQIAKPPASLIFHVTVPDDGGRTLYGAPRKLIDGVAGGLDHSATYHYDSAARLVNAAMGQSPATQWNFRFAYDGLQNMTGRTQNGPNPAGIGILAGYYLYGETINGKTHGPRQLTSIASEDCTTAGQSTAQQNTQLATFDYDGAGRMTSGDKRTLTYDGYDQLLRVDEVGKSPLVQYAYGYDGVRIYAQAGSQNPQYWFNDTYTTSPDGSRWNYVSVGERLVARLNFTAQSLPFHDPVAAGAVLRALNWSENQSGKIYPLVVGFTGLVLLVLALIRRKRFSWITATATATTCALLLALGSCDTVEKKRSFLETSQQRLYYHQGVAAGPVLTTTSLGAVDEERRYEPFGQVIDAWAANMSIPASFAHQPFNSLNKETDAQTKWSYHGARWMMPQSARWTAPDPAVKGPDGKFMFAPWGMNPYAYVKQSPTQYWDPDGQCDVSIGGGVNCVAPALRVDAEVNEGISIAYQQGDYAAVAGGAVLKVMNSVNIIVGSTLQGIIGLGNGYYNGISGMIEGDYNRAQLGFAEAVASGLNAKMMTPANVKPSAAPMPTAVVKPNSPPKPPAGTAARATPAHPTFVPGPHAGESIPARSTVQKFNPAERAQMNRIGQTTGCHTCGTTTPGTKSGNFVPDHQPPSALAPEGTPQQLYPQCINCSREQGLAIARQKREQ